MSEEKALALHLADALDGFADQPWTREQCAAELRRLHEVNAELLEALEHMLLGADAIWW